MSGPRREPRLPVDPLIREVDARLVRDGIAITMTSRSLLLGVSRSMLHTYVRSGIPESTADRLASKVLGLHPSLIWGDDYWGAANTREEVNNNE